MHGIKRGILGLLAFNAMLSAQDIFWLESGFASPRLMHANAAGVLLDSAALPAGSMPQQLAMGAVSGRFYWTELTYRGAGILSLPRNFSSGPATLADSLSSLRGIAVDEAAGRLYWTATDLAVGSRILFSSSGGPAQTIATFPAGSNNAPFGLALDATTQRLYWANFPAGKIQFCDTASGSVPQDLISGLGGPTGVALDGAGKIYWTEANGNRIQSANLNGTGITPILTALAKPTYLAVDSAAGRIYWSESQPPSIQYANLNGSGKTALRTGLAFPTGIAVALAPVPIAVPTSKPPASLAPRWGRQVDGRAVELKTRKKSSVLVLP